MVKGEEEGDEEKEERIGEIERDVERDQERKIETRWRDPPQREQTVGGKERTEKGVIEGEVKTDQQVSE